ncbi:ABC transporter ATP-binding protein [Metasolibacillus sp. FSL K6-0083]|uniref:ABC transporter ATP-binding protein n=1 Tax=Metasolibacillus sp. FSL K6-0083 TaxID=2921416 RepID=UPI00315A82F9
MSIVYKNLCKQYPNAQAPAVNNINLTINEGEFIVFLGPSGCGKTTLLKMTNRIYELTSGSIEINGQDVMKFKPEELRRQIGYVIQQNGLFPHMTIEQNISVVPQLLKWEQEAITKRVDELLILVHLDPNQFRKRYPNQLSGGQQQRVGIARAMAANPSILLMDEPFGAIDAITRTSLQDELHKIQRQLKQTILFVTHDVDEAIRLADRIIIMEKGEIVQFDTPYEIITNPRTEFVKKLVGDRDIYRRMNLLRLCDIINYSSSSELSSVFFEDGFHINTSVKDVFARFVETGKKEFTIYDDTNTKIDTISFDQLLKALTLDESQSPSLL